MRKYNPLATFLINQDVDLIALNFADIEEIIKAKLPPSARTYRSWWYSNLGRHLDKEMELSGAFKISELRLEDEVVYFSRKLRESRFTSRLELATKKAFAKIGIILHPEKKLAPKDTSARFDLATETKDIVVECAQIKNAEAIRDNPEIIIETIFQTFTTAPQKARKILAIEKHENRQVLEILLSEIENTIKENTLKNFEVWEINAETFEASRIWPPDETERLSTRQLQRDRKTLASDRIVSFSDNRSAADDAIKKFYELANEVSNIGANEHPEENAALVGDINIVVNIFEQDSVNAEPSFTFIQKVVTNIESFILRVSAAVAAPAGATLLVIQAYNAAKAAFGL